MSVSFSIYSGDAIDVLHATSEQSIQCVVTSPPYFGLRNYNVVGQIGNEQMPDDYVKALARVSGAIWRVLKDDGVFWLNINDSYAKRKYGKIKVGELIGIPWKVAEACRHIGWYVRAENIWHKPNARPESVKNRTTRAHEQVFMLTKSNRYYYDADAIATPIVESSRKRYSHAVAVNETYDPTRHKNGDGVQAPMELLTRAAANVIKKGTANRRSVWKIPTASYPGAHFAVFPKGLPELCIKASSREGDIVLDPFCGSGTTGMAAVALKRHFQGIELNETYRDMAVQQLASYAASIDHIDSSPLA